MIRIIRSTSSIGTGLHFESFSVLLQTSRDK